LYVYILITFTRGGHKMTSHEEKEYDALRKELEIYFSKISFMISVFYVSATAVLAWSIENQPPFICSSVYCIIIPSFIITHSYNISIMRIGAYFMSFMMIIKWKNDSMKLIKKLKKKKIIAMARNSIVCPRPIKQHIFLLVF